MTSMANATFSYTVLFGRSLKSWNTHPMLRRSWGTFQWLSCEMSRPATTIRPLVACSSRSRSLRKVDFPEPDGPTRKTNSPFWTSAVTSSERGDVSLVDLGDVLEKDHQREGDRRRGVD